MKRSHEDLPELVDDSNKKIHKRIYPLDQNRKYIGSFTDRDGYCHKQFLLTSPTNTEDKIEIEIVVKDNTPTLVVEQKETENNQSTILVDNFPHHSEILDTRVFGRSSLSSKFRSLLENTKIIEVSHKTAVFASKDSETVADVFRKLIAGNILSLPVFHDEKPPRFLGFIDILDILQFVSEKIVEPSTGTDQQFWSTWHSSQDIANTPCKEIINISKRNPTVFEPSSSSIQKVIDVMGSQNLHRIGVLNDNSLEAIITQTKLIEFLLKHDFLSDIGNIAKMTVGQMQLGFRKVFTTKTDVVTLEAFKETIAKRVSGLAVVDTNGQLVGNLSASDLKKIGYDLELFCKLFFTVGEFLELDKNLNKPVTVSPSTKFQDVVKLFVDNKIHRVFVTDGQDIIGVITPSDIFKCFQSKPHNYFENFSIEKI